jgi:peptidoglycan hydrolase-like protein with peptidoglycan-binding domain
MSAIDKKYQRYLFDLQLYDGVVDGVIGPKTRAALTKFQTMNGLPETGVLDKPTIDEFELELKVNPLSDEEEDVVPYTFWPKETTETLMKYYGPVGENQVRIDTPYRMVLAWEPNTVLNKITCHKKVAESLYSALENVSYLYSQQDIIKHGFNLFGGTLNVRKIRGGNRWSTHSWGIAIDIDPARNGLHLPWNKAYLGKPECRDFVDCFKQEGWYSLGLEKNYDAMHFQACWRS